MVSKSRRIYNKDSKSPRAKKKLSELFRQPNRNLCFNNGNTKNKLKFSEPRGYLEMLLY